MLTFPLDHIGIAVRDLDETLHEYKRNFGATSSHREIIGEQKVAVAFIQLPNTKIELLAPTVSGGTLSRFIEERGPGLHHLCYHVELLEPELAKLKKLGHSLIDASPRPGANGSRIAFIHPKTMGGVLIELCDYPK